MSDKNWSNLYFELLKANDDLLGKEWSSIKSNKDAAHKLADGVKNGGWKKYFDALASLKESAIKSDSTISSKVESVWVKIEEKWKGIHDLVSK